MSAYTRVSIETTIYCDGATHAPIYASTTTPSQTAINAAIRGVLARAGWTKDRDGNTYCPNHRPKGGSRR